MPALSRLACCTFIAAVLSACGKEAQQPQDTEVRKQPNILLLIADDFGVDQSPQYTDGVTPMPSIESLAQSGVTFENIWSSPLCSPTRATILSGQHGFNSGFSWVIPGTFPELGFDDRLDSPHFLPRMVREQGYETAMIGKWHVSSTDLSDPIQTGFDYFSGTIGSFGVNDGVPKDSIAAYWNTTSRIAECRGAECAILEFSTPPEGWPVAPEFHPNYRTTWEVDQALAWTAGTSKPWFVWLGFQSPHTPLQLPPRTLVDPGIADAVIEYLGAYEDGFWVKVDDEDDELRRLVYSAMVSALDTEIGRLLSNIDLENTLVIFVGDNGATTPVADPALVPPRHAKGSLYEGGINVPFVINGPEIKTPGSRSKVLGHTSDIHATILAAAGATIDENGQPTPVIDGRSLLNVVTDGTESVYGRQFVFSNNYIIPGVNPAFPVEGQPSGPPLEGEAVRGARYKLIRLTSRDRTTGFRCSSGPQPSADNRVPCGVSDRVKELQLYDLAEDPLEMNDLLANGESELTAEQVEAFSRLHRALTEATY